MPVDEGSLSDRRPGGEFPKQDDDVLIPLEHTEAAAARDDADVGEDRRLGVDVARFGTDRTVFTLRSGARVEYVEVQAKKDTMEVAARAKVLAERLNASAVYVDVIGVGAGVVDKLKLDGVEVVAVNAAEVAPNRSANKDDAQGRIMRDYLWIEMARWLREDEPAFLIDKDLAEDLAGEPASVKYGIDGKGYLTVEMKDQMRKRLGRSPDLADSLALTFAPKLGFGILDYYRQMFEEREQAKADRADQVMNQEIPQVS
ncbi:hypothetical protein [Skermanella pratensis]|uniref:hypothetical protein n=1 Tax=Skermanella pratensis TaxID=2233999 RepID=UPI001FE7D472|nr:hypothetical protein [Skermanella pratensis]